MANITWKVTTSAGAVEKSSPELSDTNMTRFIDWVWEHYPQYQADGETLKTRNLANEAAAVNDWIDREWNKTKNTVLRWERKKAEQVASESVTDLE